MSKNWQKILEEIAECQRNILEKDGVTIWFRGQSKSSWSLESSLHRYVKGCFKQINKDINDPKARKFLREQFKTLYIKYKERAWHLLNESERHEWAMIFSMRHHGIPSLLLDWTSSFLCALYFANLERRPKEDAAIFLLHPPQLNEKSKGVKHLIALEEKIRRDDKIKLELYHPMNKKPEEDLPPLAVTPVLSNKRMIAQNTTFVFSGDSFEPLEKTYKSCIKKIVLPADTFGESNEYLRLNGASRFSYFPDLYGLAGELNDGLKLQVDLYKKHKRK